IYPSYSAITDANAANLLKLADRFQIMSIVDDIEQFLVDWSYISIIDRLCLSDQYRLVDLQEHCLNEFETFKDIKKIKDTESYKNLSDKAKAAIMDRTLNLE
ncbi:hypothetical protein PMAYCL1PPCAC_24894, partial [Pristionchus mayeri]